MKYTGNCLFAILSFCVISFSMTKVLLTTECVAKTYRMRDCPYFGLDSGGK
jgi:hypothetical protein